MPSPTGLVVKNGSKTRFFSSSGTPGPVSPIETITWSSSRYVLIVSVPAPFMAWTALSIRLVHTWFSSAGWAGICGSVRS